MDTQYKSPAPPDYKECNERNIELSYDPMEQGTVAWIEEWVKPGEKIRRKICWLPDGASVRHERDLKTLMSWATRVDVKPDLPEGHPLRKSCYYGWSYYPLPDTPMVREILHRIDYSHQRELWEKLRNVLIQIEDAGFYLNVFVAEKDAEMILRPNISISLVK
jgi:hypothetical protein